MNFERQHIVPRSYLRRFATKIPKKKRYQIGVIDKSGRAFSQSIDNVGYVKNYYDTNCREDKKHWEHYFANEIEPHYGRDLDLIISKVHMAKPGTVVLNEYDQEILTAMMCFQMMRNPEFIEKTIEGMSQFIYGYKKRFIKQNPWLSPEQVRLIKKINFSKDKCKDEVLKIITDNERYIRFSKELSKKAWFVFYNPFSNKYPFFTSDNPVTFCYLNKDTTIRLGIGRNDILIYYPLTPSIMIAIYPPYFLLSKMISVSGSLFVLTSEEIDFINGMNNYQINNCYKQVFLPVSALRYYENMREG